MVYCATDCSIHCYHLTFYCSVLLTLSLLTTDHVLFALCSLQSQTLCGQHTYIQEAPIAEYAKQGVDMALTGEIQARSDMAPWRQDTP